MRAWDREASTERMHPLRTLSPLRRQKGAVPWEEVEREGGLGHKVAEGQRAEGGVGVGGSQQQPGSKEIQGTGS